MEKSQEGFSATGARRVSGIAYLKLLGLLAIFGLTLGRVRTLPQPHTTVGTLKATFLNVASLIFSSSRRSQVACLGFNVQIVQLISVHTWPFQWM